MLLYIIRRIIAMIGVLAVTVTFIFTLMNFVPGDPAIAILGPEKATVETIKEVHQKYHLDDPFALRLARYGWHLLQGDMGTSYRSQEPVIKEVLSRYPTTLKVTFGSMFLGIVIGVSIGVLSAVKQYSIFDRIFTSISLFGASAPSFWIAMLWTLAFSVRLGWLPATGSHGLKFWILPIMTMGLQTSASIMRMTRSCMLEVVRQDYIRTARAKGQSELKVIFGHALRNASLPILTVAGILFCSFLGGSVLIETVFALPGLGKFILEAVEFQDYPAIFGSILWICINCVIITFIVDMLYGFLDPRIKTNYSAGKRGKIARSSQS
jgi:peptide/nickel transport system permease protein